MDKQGNWRNAWRSSVVIGLMGTLCLLPFSSAQTIDQAQPYVPSKTDLSEQTMTYHVQGDAVGVAKNSSMYTLASSNSPAPSLASESANSVNATNGANLGNTAGPVNPAISGNTDNLVKASHSATTSQAANSNKTPHVSNATQDFKVSGARADHTVSTTSNNTNNPATSTTNATIEGRVIEHISAIDSDASSGVRSFDQTSSSTPSSAHSALSNSNDQGNASVIHGANGANQNHGANGANGINGANIGLTPSADNDGASSDATAYKAQVSDGQIACATEAKTKHMPAAIAEIIELVVQDCSEISNGQPKHNFTIDQLTMLRDYALEKDDPDAQNAMGLLSLQGKYMRPSPVKAAIYFSRAAAQNHAAAKNNLGELYLTGHGVDQNTAIAVAWFEQAAAQGLCQAQYNLGRLYLEGHGVNQDVKRGFDLLKQAANQGHVSAQFVVGRLYLEGTGTKTSKSQAAKWFNKACLQNFKQACRIIDKLNLRIKM